MTQPCFARVLNLRKWGTYLEGTLFRKDLLTYVPLYEAKMIHLFNHRYGDFAILAAGTTDHVLPRATAEMLDDPNYFVLPGYWVPQDPAATHSPKGWNHKWLLG